MANKTVLMKALFPRLTAQAVVPGLNQRSKLEACFFFSWECTFSSVQEGVNFFQKEFLGETMKVFFFWFCEERMISNLFF